MSGTKTKAYWTIQIGVWATLNSALLLGYWLGGNGLDVTFWQAAVDFTLYCLLSIFFSHFMKLLINKYCAIDNLQWIDILKIFGILLSSVTLLYLTYSIHIQVTYRFIYERVDVFDHPSQSALYQILFYINTLLYFFVWVVFYIAIKGLMELNKSRQDRLQLESNLKESLLNTLKGQINPHFMFNSLNNIRGLMLEDVDRSREMLTRLSEMLRYSLTKSTSNSIPLEEELESVDNFISISKIQFEERLKFEKKVDPALLSRQIPPMIVQLLIENAIKHGISKLKEGGFVRLEVFNENEMFIVKVTNSGNLTFDENSTKLGLENIRKRLQLLYGDKASFSLSENNNEVTAIIAMP